MTHNRALEWVKLKERVDGTGLRQMLPEEPERCPDQDEIAQNLCSGKYIELIAKHTQANKTLFNIKETCLLHAIHPTLSVGDEITVVPPN